MRRVPDMAASARTRSMPLASAKVAEATTRSGRLRTARAKPSTTDWVTTACTPWRNSARSSPRATARDDITSSASACRFAGPFAGLSADLAHRFLPRTLAEGGRAAATGVAFVGALFVLVLLALSVSYLDPAPGLAHYLNGIGFTLPWLLVTGGFAGYVAHALRRAAGGARAEGPAHAGASPPYQG